MTAMGYMHKLYKLSMNSTHIIMCFCIYTLYYFADWLIEVSDSADITVFIPRGTTRTLLMFTEWDHCYRLNMI